jgi:CrcB protein
MQNISFLYSVLSIGIGGFIGAISRFLISSYINNNYKLLFFNIPVGTLVVNLIGSFLIGILMSYFSQNNTISDNFKLVLITGFLGALTTYSTFAYETFLFLENKNYFLALINILLNNIGTILMVYFGHLLFKII